MNRTHLSQLAVLATVAQCGSFRGAARELAIAPSAVSHAVSSLEARQSEAPIAGAESLWL
ncbi:MAG: LysR family transcriptional regulator, partial [Mesorhizobium sp.]